MPYVCECVVGIRLSLIYAVKHVSETSVQVNFPLMGEQRPGMIPGDLVSTVLMSTVLMTTACLWCYLRMYVHWCVCMFALVCVVCLY